LSYIQSNPEACKLSEKNDRLRLIYTQIHTIDQANKRLSEINT
jgi:transcription-repair coupling factor (superfamily II helicase)